MEKNKDAFFFKTDDYGDISHLKVGRIVLVTLIPILSVVTMLKTFTTVSAGTVGVVTRAGAVNRVANPGLVVKIPFFESIYEMETRTQIEQIDASSASKDLQEVKATIALNFHLRGEKAVEVYQVIGIEYKDRIIAPAMQEAFKATTAQFTASELIGKREEVKSLAFEELKNRLDKYNIVVDDFNIVNFDFSQEFNSAIEAKTVAQQNKERANIEAETALIQAEGQANAQKALRDNGGLSPEYLEFLAVQKWNGVMPLSTNGSSFINLK